MDKKASGTLYRKVLLTMLGTVLVLCLSLGGLSIHYGSVIAYEDAMDLLDRLMREQRAVIEERLERVRTVARQVEVLFLRGYDVADMRNDQAALDRWADEFEPVLRDLLGASRASSGWLQVDSAKTGANLNLSLFRDGEGGYEREPPFDVYVTGAANDEWYRGAMYSGETWTAAYRWEPWDADVVSYSRRMEKDGVVVGVAGSEIFIDDLTGDLSRIRVYGSGGLALLDSLFRLLYFPEPGVKDLRTWRNGALARLADTIPSEAGSCGIFEYEYLGSVETFPYFRLSNGWVLGATPPGAEVFARQRWLALAIGIITVAGLVAASLLSVWLSRLATAPILALATELERLATTDPLTGAWNRRYFEEVFEREIALARRSGLPLSLVMMDLDHFKRVNDRYGHEVGDDSLLAMAAAVRQILRAGDVFARAGGEEFYVLMPHTRVEDACRAAERLRVAIHAIDSVKRAGKTVRLSASFGVSCLEAEDDMRAMIERADEATYRSKEHGRNRVTRA